MTGHRNMAAKINRVEPVGSIEAPDQFIFVEMPVPSNDNVYGFGSVDGSKTVLATVSPDIMFTVGEFIFDLDDSDPSEALMVALDGAEAEAGEYAAFSTSVMFVFGDVAADG